MIFRFRSSLTSHSEDAPRRLSERLDLSRAAAEILCLRGVDTPEKAENFLAPQLKSLPDPFLLKDMDRAVALVCEAMKRQWPVVVYGDYDVDGICATTLLVDFLKKCGITARWHVPNRLTEGYGLTSSGLQKIRRLVETPALLITVDNGISAIGEVVEAIAAGFHVIITDHHEPLGEIPRAHAVVNPKQQDCGFPFSGLSGAGVAFFFIVALRAGLLEEGIWQKDNVPNLKKYLDLVALGTVADVMPLVGVNRILVRAGLEVLSQRTRPGIWALCEEAGLQEGPVTSEDISFRLAPRINAAGRLGSPEIAAHLLMSENIGKSQKSARNLEEKNKERREIEGKIVTEAIRQCATQVEQGACGLVVYQNDWHPGVLGIVASRICEQFHLPSIALADDYEPGIVKGSGRSVDGLNLLSAVKDCEKLLVHFGGHKQAVGLALNSNAIQEFSSMLNNRLRLQENKNKKKGQVLIIDRQLSGNEPDENFLAFLKHLEPFGNGNPEPVFLTKNTKLERVSLVKKKHLRFALKLGSTRYQGIGFGMEDKIRLVRERVDLAFVFKHSCFRGRKRIEIRAIAITPTT